MIDPEYRMWPEEGALNVKGGLLYSYNPIRTYFLIRLHLDVPSSAIDFPLPGSRLSHGAV
jgi:hypothetical protein